MVFEYILKKMVSNPAKRLTIVQNISFGLTAQAFCFRNRLTTLLNLNPVQRHWNLKGQGYVIASLGVDSGLVPYTAYSALKKFYR